MKSQLIDLSALKQYDNNLKDVARLLRRSCDYQVGDKVSWKGVYLKCITAGKTGTVTPALSNLNIGDTVNDNTAKWEVIDFGSGGSGTKNNYYYINHPVGHIEYAYELLDGYLAFDGTTKNRIDYPDLVNWITSNNLWTNDPNDIGKFGVGDGSTTFVMPNFINKFIEGDTTSGTSKDAGLPNIQSTQNGIRVQRDASVTPSPTDPLVLGSTVSSPLHVWQDCSSNDFNIYKDASFDASKASPVYGKSTTVQPSSVTLIPQIKYRSDSLFNIITACFEKEELYTSSAYANADTTVMIQDLSTYDYIAVTYSYSADGVTSSYSDTAVIKTDEAGVHDLTFRKDNSTYMELGATIFPSKIDFDMGQSATLTHYKIDCINGFKLGKGNNAYILDYDAGTTYQAGTVITYKGAIYRCSVPHTATATFDPTKWVSLSASGGTTIAKWKSATSYAIDAMVNYEDILYRCISAHTSSTTFDLTKWALLSGVVDNAFSYDSNNNLIPTGTGRATSVVEGWQPNTVYLANQAVYANGGFYFCLQKHTSGNAFMTDFLSGKWTYIGREGHNNITQEEIYDGTNDAYLTTPNESVKLSVNANLSDYDYCLVTMESWRQDAKFAEYTTIICDKRHIGSVYPLAHMVGAMGVYTEIIFDNPFTLVMTSHTSHYLGAKIKSIVGIKFNYMTTGDIANLAMPSDQYITISSTPWVAPQSGLVVVTLNSLSSGMSGGTIRVNNIKVVDCLYNAGAAGYTWVLTALVAKGDTITTTTANVSANTQFYYSIGAAKELGLI